MRSARWGSRVTGLAPLPVGVGAGGAGGGWGGRVGVVCQGHAAFAGGDGLVGVETEYRYVGCELPYQRALPGGGQGVRGILHHLEPMLLSDRKDFIHSAGQAAVVHRHDGLGPWRDGGADGLGGDVQRHRVHVHQHGVGAEVAHHLHRGGEGEGGRDHLVARADAQGFQCEVQAGGGRVDGDGLQSAAPQVVGEGLFEGAGLRAGGHPARAQGVGDGGDFGVANVGPGEGEEGLGGIRLVHVKNPLRRATEGVSFHLRPMAWYSMFSVRM